MIATISGWVAIVCFALAAMIEPKEPKRDGRFRTGYKNNATIRKKTADEKEVQMSLLVIGVVSSAAWYFLR